jgi:hypothetical protein
MSNPAQPSFVWQLYSHDLEPNASLYGARKACEPVHVMMNQADWHAMVVNNTTNPLNSVSVRTLIYNLDGSLQAAATNTVNAANSAVTDVGAISFPQNLSPVHFVKLELRDERDRLLSDNFYWRAAPEHEDDFQALNRMPMVTVDVTAKKHESHGQCVLEVTLHNTSRVPALMAHLQLRRGRSGQRVLPVFYSDNYVSLLGRETKSLTVEAASVDLAGEEPLLVVDGWNVAVNPSNSKSVQVAPNAGAVVQTGVVTAKNDHEVSINCGGGRPGFSRFGDTTPGFAADHDFKGGNTANSRDEIDLSATNSAPAEVYQTERWGDCSYIIPVGKEGPRTVRLHFAEVRFGPGERKFNVDLNGRRVLADFDIAAVAGKDRALVKDFEGINPDSNGNIVITFSRGSADEPKICGIQILK